MTQPAVLPNSDEFVSLQWDSIVNAWCPIHQDSTGLALLCQGLMYGYGHYTSFLWPVSEIDWERHWQRLTHDSQYLGLSISSELKNHFYKAISDLPDAGQYRYRLSHVPMVHRFQELTSQPEMEANWLLTAQRRVMPTAVPVSLKILPYARRHASVKHFQIADTIFEKRQLALKTDNHPVTDVLYTCRDNGEIVLLEAGFANLLLIKPKEKLAISPDPNIQECLSGVEIRRVMDELLKAGWKVQWERVSTHDLAQDCSLFLTNAVQGVVPVKAIYPEAGANPIWERDRIKAYSELLALP